MLKIIMNIVIGICMFLFTSCKDRFNEKKEDSQNKVEKKPITFYNLAYQENYKKDNIKSTLKHAKDAYILVDVFDDDFVDNISKLKENNNQISGYISVGTGEDYRDDFSALKPYLTSKEWSEWEGEFYISKLNNTVLSIMKKRIDKMSKLGIDWVEFDNMDWLTNETRKKFKLKATVNDARTYLNTLCDYVHSKGMKCMAKNIVNGFENFDGVTYESYSKEKNWWDKKGTNHFIADNKLVMINHYKEKDCKKVYKEYQKLYGKNKFLFICEDIKSKRYKHF